MAIQHADSQHIHKFAYVQPTDPGAVGASKGWVDTSNPIQILKVRNATNTGWDNIGVFGSQVIGGVGNSVQLLQSTTWAITQSPEVIFLIPPGKNLILDKIVLTSIDDLATGIPPGETISITAGPMNLISQVYNRANINWSDFNKGVGLAGPGYAATITGRYDPDDGFLYDFGLIDNHIEIESSWNFIPYDVRVYVFGTLIDSLY